MIKKIKLEKYHYIALTGWIAKIFTVVFSLINTRLLLDLIGVEGFALYSIIFSLGGWLFLFNFSIPAAVQNTISKFRVKNQNLKPLYQTVVFIMVIIIIFVIPMLYFITLILNQTFLENYSSIIEFKYLFIALFLLVLFGLTDIFNKILFGQHKGYWPNLYPLFISISGFLILMLLKFLNVTTVSITIVIFMFPYFIVFILSYIQSVGLIFPKFYKTIFLEMYQLIKKFFIFSVLATLVLHVDYIIMAKVLSAYDITIYNLDMRIFNLILFIYWTLLSALWPVSSELFYKNRLKEIKKKLHINILFGFIITLIISILIIVFKDSIFFLISGNKMIKASYMAIILTIIYILTRIWTDSYAKILQSMNEVKILIYTVPFQAIISVVVQYYLGAQYGLNGILTGLILSFILTVAWVLPLKFYKLTKEK